MSAPNSLLAVIDLGTNTFHLLVAEAVPGGTFKEVYRERRFVKLAQEGIQHIGPSAYERGVQTMLDYRQILDTYGVTHLRVFGTAALRTADNGQDFISEVRGKTGIGIQLIDGDQEARYILRGVRLAIPFEEVPRLIMDIGGGSVEFILASASKVYWVHSFPIGVAVLYRKFHRHEPMEPSENQQLQDFLKEQLAPLKRALEQYPVQHLVGVSGTFDVLENLLEIKYQNEMYAILGMNGFVEILHRMLGATFEERLHLKGVPPYRADMIVVALLLIDFVLNCGPFKEIWVSHYDLKEGMLDELLETL